MTEKGSLHPYDDLKNEIRPKIFYLLEEYVPKMYGALRNEGLSPVDARVQIEKDLAFIRSSKIVVACLPYESTRKPRIDPGTLMRGIARMRAESSK